MGVCCQFQDDDLSILGPVATVWPSGYSMATIQDDGCHIANEEKLSSTESMLHFSQEVDDPLLNPY